MAINIVYPTENDSQAANGECEGIPVRRRKEKQRAYPFGCRKPLSDREIDVLTGTKDKA